MHDRRASRGPPTGSELRARSVSWFPIGSRVTVRDPRTLRRPHESAMRVKPCTTTPSPSPRASLSQPRRPDPVRPGAPPPTCCVRKNFGLGRGARSSGSGPCVPRRCAPSTQPCEARPGGRQVDRDRPTAKRQKATDLAARPEHPHGRRPGARGLEAGRQSASRSRFEPQWRQVAEERNGPERAAARARQAEVPTQVRGRAPAVAEREPELVQAALAALKGPTSTVPARGENVNALTRRPFTETLSRAVADLLVKKWRVTSQPTESRTTSGLPRLRAAKVAPVVEPWVLKLAETAFAVFITSVQVCPVPLQAPPQPRKTAPRTAWRAASPSDPCRTPGSSRDCRIVDRKSSPLAADEMHITQPAASLSRSAAWSASSRPSCWDRWRARRTVVPTDAGQVLYRYGREILDLD